jgi:catechol 2,3-dioxygenase
MSSALIGGVRSVALEVPDLGAAETFYTNTWHLTVAARGDGVIYLRGTGSDHHLLALHRGGPQTRVRCVTLRARHEEDLGVIARAAVEAGGTVLAGPGAIDDPAGGLGVTIRDPDGRVLQIVHGDRRHGDTQPQAGHPVRLAHVVMNSHDVAASLPFYARVLDVHLIDRTRIMAFLNCARDHHSLALADADNDALNHIAFLMPDLESVMRGGGRMKDAGHEIQWGPGRHGPGDNAFNYFIGPFGEVIEYTAEVEQVDDSYRVGSPADWQWPPGRSDHWGIARLPTPELKRAQQTIFFVPAQERA